MKNRYSCINMMFIILLLLLCAGFESRQDVFAQSTIEESKEEVRKFVIGVVSNYFPTCSLIFFNADLQTFPSSSLIGEISNSVINARFYTSFNSTKSLSANNDFHRLSSYCKLVITTVLHVQTNFSDSFTQLVTPMESPIAKRDEDYFIFITKNEGQSSALLSSHISYQLRFKLVTHSQQNKGTGKKSLSVRSLCIYCSNSMTRFVTVSSNSLDSLESIFPDFTRNFHQHKIRISGPTKYMATYEMEKVNGTYRHKRGIHTLVYNTVAQKLNMSYTLHPCSKFDRIPAGSSGVFLGNGTWAGCMGDVINNITDMSLSVSPDDKRINYVDFTSAIEYTPVTYTTLKPGDYYSWKTVFYAFGPIVWMLVSVSVLLTCALIHTIDVHCAFKHGSTKMELTKLIQLGMYLFGYLVGQDIPTPPKHVSSKFAYLIWLYYGMVIGAVYACSLQALIVSPDMESVPRTFSDLTNSQNYEWGAATGFRNGLGEQVFKNSDNPIMQQIYHKMEGDSDDVNCIAKVAMKKYACFNWALMQQFRFQTTFADKTGNHPFWESTDSAFFVSLNFITRKREIFLSHFNSFIKFSLASGLTKQTIARDWRGYRMRDENIQERKIAGVIQVDTIQGTRPFGLDNVKGSFIVLLSGLAIGVISLVIEAFAGLNICKYIVFCRNHRGFSLKNPNSQSKSITSILHNFA